MATRTITPTRNASALPTPSSLRAAAQFAAGKGEPLVVMTTLAGCPYCELVRRHHLLPMLNAGEVIAIQIDVRDRRTLLQGFQGESSNPAEQAELWKATFTPTVLFFGPKGEELAERLEGVAVPDFFGEYLDARLSEARKRLRG